MSCVFKKKSSERWKLAITVPSSFKDRIDSIKKGLSELAPDQEFDYQEYLEEMLDKRLKQAEKELKNLKGKGGSASATSIDSLVET